MSETQNQKSFFRRHWEWYKEHLVVEEFIASDPAHGPTPKTAREVSSCGAVGALLGGKFGVELGFKYCKSLYGAALGFGIGSVIGCMCSDWIVEQRKMRQKTEDDLKLDEL